MKYLTEQNHYIERKKIVLFSVPILKALLNTGYSSDKGTNNTVVLVL